jgi:hypothetical protein
MFCNVLKSKEEGIAREIILQFHCSGKRTKHKRKEKDRKIVE